MKTSKFASFNIQKVLVIIGLFIISLSACTRYSYIPRHHEFFGLTKLPKNKVTHFNQKKTGDVASFNKTLKSTEVSMESETALIENGGKEIVINGKDFGNKLSENKKNICYKNIDLLPRIKHAILYSENNTLMDKLKPSNHLLKRTYKKNLISKTGDEEGKTFSILAAISFALSLTALLGFFLGSGQFLLLFAFFSLAALVTGIIALIIIWRKKKKYSNRFMAYLGAILGLIELFCITVVILLFLYMFSL